MTPDRARAIIKNFCAEYCDGQEVYVVNGVTYSMERLNDAELVDVARKVIGIMIQFAVNERKGATIQ